MKEILKENMRTNTHYLSTWKHHGRQWFGTCMITEKGKIILYDDETGKFNRDIERGVRKGMKFYEKL